MKGERGEESHGGGLDMDNTDQSETRHAVTVSVCGGLSGIAASVARRHFPCMRSPCLYRGLSCLIPAGHMYMYTSKEVQPIHLESV